MIDRGKFDQAYQAFRKIEIQMEAVVYSSSYFPLEILISNLVAHIVDLKPNLVNHFHPYPNFIKWFM